MADSGIKFIRVRGRVIPIRADKVGSQGKKAQKSASDTVSRKDAAKSLLSTAKFQEQKGSKSSRLMKFSFGASVGFTAASALVPQKYKTGLQVSAIGAATVGGLASLGRAGAKQSAMQLRRDAQSIRKGSPLSEKGRLLGPAAARARAYSSFFERRLKENQGKPTGAQINPMPPKQSSKIPPPVPRSRGTTSV